MFNGEATEQQRLALQVELDASRSRAERNRLGQFATPTELAREIMAYAAEILPTGEPIRFLDPAIGTGSFYSALSTVFSEDRIEKALGFEIDPYYCEPANRLWQGGKLALQLGDFTKQTPTPDFNLIICNPPYVRHHHLQNGDKFRLQTATRQASGMKLSGLAGLYCHFLGLAHPWLATGGLAGWLIPSEFMDVNYGQALKHYLLERVTLLHIHRFDPHDGQFADALVSSAIVWLRNVLPPPGHQVLFTKGGTLRKPETSRLVPVDELAQETKWTHFPAQQHKFQRRGPKLADFFQIKRGIATGDNKFFILSDEKVQTLGLPERALRPILPSPRYLADDTIAADLAGNPLVAKKLFLLDTSWREQEIRENFPVLWGYLEYGRQQGVHQGYICSHRTPWYSQEYRPPAPIVCTYIGRSGTGRGRPFRFILNESRATVANVYLAMYPTPVLNRALQQDAGLLHRVWQVLNAIRPEQLISEGRVYGGGMFKLEPKELANLDATDIAALIPGWQSEQEEQLRMFG